MARLWETFPHPQYFDAGRSLVSVRSVPAARGAPFGPEQSPEQSVLFTSTMDWLINEGFVRGTGLGLGAFAKVVLTTRGFTILRDTPHSISGNVQSTESKRSLGTAVRDAVEKRAIESVAGLISALLGLP